MLDLEGIRQLDSRGFLVRCKCNGAVTYTTAFLEYYYINAANVMYKKGEEISTPI